MDQVCLATARPATCCGGQCGVLWIATTAVAAASPCANEVCERSCMPPSACTASRTELRPRGAPIKAIIDGMGGGGRLGSCCGPACVDIFQRQSELRVQCRGFGCRRRICESECLIAETRRRLREGYSLPHGRSLRRRLRHRAPAAGFAPRGCDGTTNFCAPPEASLAPCCGSKAPTSQRFGQLGACDAICPAEALSGRRTVLPGSHRPPTFPCPRTICTQMQLREAWRLRERVHPTARAAAARSPDQSSCLLSSSKTGICCNGQCTDLARSEQLRASVVSVSLGSLRPTAAFFYLRILRTAGGSCLPTVRRTPASRARIRRGLPQRDCMALTSSGAGPCPPPDGRSGSGVGTRVHHPSTSENCGRCGTPVRPASPASPIVPQRLRVATGGTLRRCGEHPAAREPIAIDTRTDSVNCGSCGLQCAPGTRSARRLRLKPASASSP